jgi:homoserine kinase type II
VSATCTITEEQLQQVLRYYCLGKLTACRRLERGFVNENWVIETTRGRFFLKRRHPTLRDPTLVRAQHALVDHLRESGFPAPAVLPTAGGETLLALEGELYEVQEFVDGTLYDHDRPAHLSAAARTLARYHESVRGLAAPALRRPGTLYSPAALHTNLARLVEAWEIAQDSVLVHAARQLEEHISDLAARFAAHGELPHLHIHGDYYAGNLLFEGDRVAGVVDYDKARWQPRVVELAEALIYFSSPRPGHLEHLVYSGFVLWEPFIRFLRSYARVETPGERELQALPDYVRCIWLQMSLLRLEEKGARPLAGADALHEVIELGDWARENGERMIETAKKAIGAP